MKKSLHGCVLKSTACTIMVYDDQMYSYAQCMSHEFCNSFHTRFISTDEVISHFLEIQTVSPVLMVVQYHKMIQTCLGHCTSQVLILLRALKDLSDIAFVAGIMIRS